MIWGTTVNVDYAMARFRAFLNEFQLSESERERGGDALDDDDGALGDGAPLEGHYIGQLREARERRVLHLSINCRHLATFARSRELYAELVHYPQEIVPIMDLTLHEEYCKRFDPDELGNRRMQARPRPPRSRAPHASRRARARDGLARATFSPPPCLLYTSPSPRDRTRSRMPSSA